MLTSFKAYKSILEKIEVIITSDELASRDLFQFYDDLKNKMLSKSNEAFENALMEAIQEYGVEVEMSRNIGSESEPKFTFVFRSKKVLYKLNVNFGSLTKRITLHEFNKLEDAGNWGFLGTFNTITSVKNLKDAFKALKDYERVNGDKVCLTIVNMWNGGTENVYLDRSFLKEIPNEEMDGPIPKRILLKIRKIVDESKVSSADTKVRIPFKDEIYITNGYTTKLDKD